MLAVVIVLGPALPITIVKLVVPPTAIVLLATALVRLGVICTSTVPGAVAVRAAQVGHPHQRRQRHRVRVPVGPRGLTTIVTVTVPPVGSSRCRVPSCRSG
jgi:NhaP-type Na+/H+ or K+/H+ antiporter